MPLPTAGRNRVLWLGNGCPEDFKSACKDRDLEVLAVTPETAPTHWAKARAIVFHQPDKALQDAIRVNLAGDALCHGLYVKALADKDAVTPLNELFATLDVRLRLTAWDLSGLLRVAEEIARHDPQAGLSDAHLEGCEDCGLEDMVLLRRAFSDCSKVQFRALTKDHRRIYQAFATLKASVAGPYPLPFLVKLEDHKRAERERNGYDQATRHFIPFYARPNLDLARCLQGATRGVLVANFIESAESLHELVQRGAAQSAINSLFEDALRGWRTQAYWNKTEATGSLAAEGVIRSYGHEHRNRAEERAREAKPLGATMTAGDIAALLDGLPAIRHRVAFSHCDLHGENVQVRSGQAMLIDFLRVASQPIVHDPAALETSLALTFKAQDVPWREVMTELYDLANLTTLPPLHPPQGPLTNLWNAVRQVRRFGLADQVSDREYARSVAIHLLRHALRKRQKSEPTERRPLMVFLAERLAKQLAAAG